MGATRPAPLILAPRYGLPRELRLGEKGAGGTKSLYSRIKVVLVAAMFITMGASMAWVFERLSPEAQFVPHGDPAAETSLADFQPAGGPVSLPDDALMPAR